MKTIRQIGSTVFVLGLFVTIFAGVPWHVITSDDPVVPIWLRLAIFCLLGGVLVVLGSLALEQFSNRFTAPVELPDKIDSDILLLNSDAVPNRQITEALGLAQGHTVFAIWLGKDIAALMRLILGGELTEYTDMMGRARTAAANRMIARAKDMGADAIINVRYMTTGVIGTASELLVYGTAVKLAT